ncbi:GNAT family N-acetyltransferase [Dactylosporangium roseum]|uniref:GNAT family N-acetyltransferase n=1 Tax=Dactylosporangium roseum TaxID=47989 RepID=A0ABY5Z6U0_9ACTN|nr:GNAT family N-acetyltransferase [Dactylosporangium roseum]UWZ37577.1 GNAT family N-acetyltransferase [Dactylosporangium roseum]
MTGLRGLPGWTVRGCSLRDVPAILAITRAGDIAALGEPDWSEDEIVATLTAPNQDPAVDMWLAFDPSGAAVAWAYLDNPQRGARDNVEVYGTPECGWPAYGPLLDLALPRVAERARDAGHAGVTLRAGTLAVETAYVAVLREKGFRFVKRHARMRRVLTGQEQAPGGPDVRPVRAGDDAEMRRFHEVLESAFADTPDYQPTSYGDWRAALRRLPSVSFDEWFVHLADGEVVGVLQSADQAVEHNEGWVKNLAVLRPHRKAGIGGALLRTAFAAYAAKGRTSAGLGVDLTNPTGAYELYTGVGMTMTFAADMYERRVTA